MSILSFVKVTVQAIISYCLCLMFLVGRMEVFNFKFGPNFFCLCTAKHISWHRFLFKNWLDKSPKVQFPWIVSSFTFVLWVCSDRSATYGLKRRIIKLSIVSQWILLICSTFHQPLIYRWKPCSNVNLEWFLIFQYKLNKNRRISWITWIWFLIDNHNPIMIQNLIHSQIIKKPIVKSL